MTTVETSKSMCEYSECVILDIIFLFAWRLSVCFPFLWRKIRFYSKSYPLTKKKKIFPNHTYTVKYSRCWGDQNWRQMKAKQPSAIWLTINNKSTAYTYIHDGEIKENRKRIETFLPLHSHGSNLKFAKVIIPNILEVVFMSSVFICDCSYGAFV